MGGGNNAGCARREGRYFFLLNSDAWVIGDGMERLVGSRTPTRDAAVVGPKLLEHRRHAPAFRSRRADPLARRDRVSVHPQARAEDESAEPALCRGIRPFDGAEADWLSGAALLVRREATDAVGLFDESFFSVQRGG